ncbi:bifunctional 2-polyprenyl-6-hydroxyphenol methylase/3-demethylubiquinol 3-O-methyltransferase UbiG [Mesoflavibacter sp. SCSIO 43206]|uniref:class I SAM-dependent methyltransferase n=1 Tax=Mesoflavibacter sp. SCSIO 43206 TaxID=2779362 RepID=UPI001CA91638|nr:class I SAM-dependent methyltransferase [Mesoflavibacter sp. SCSIO 43206]UAB74378.1 class I SAM-dependent methyltransferase [Mesoflavibacter sp. SCSIO 43206]
MKDLNDAFSTNKATWNKKVKAHANSDFYNLDAFINGENSLNAYELKALPDVKGKSLLHLQCHFGQDTLSWSKLGAKCTGVDLSDEGVKLAQQLNNQLKLDANFICCNVLDTSQHVKEQFDIVFTSYGVIGWLPDLKPWGKMIAERLKEGGTFYMVEFHPIVWMFDYLDGQPKMKYGYMQDEAIYEEYEGTYADTDSKMISKEYGWNHGLSEVINALTEAGLRIDYLNEHDESPYNVLPNLEQTKSETYVTKDKLYPLIFEIKARKV